MRSIEGPPIDPKSWSYSLAGQAYEMRWEQSPCHSVPAGSDSECFLLRIVSSPLPNYSVCAPNVGSIYGVSGPQNDAP